MNIRIAIAAVALLAGCEKAGPKESGEVTSKESDLLAHLPADADFAFGGNFMKLQNLFQDGPLGSLLAQAESMAPGLKAWTDCFISHTDMVMYGSISGSAMEMRMLMKGIDLDDIEKCANAAKFGVKVDADKKYIEIKQEGIIAQTLGYLVLEDGAIYGKQGLSFGFDIKKHESDRKTLEADIAGTKKSNALSNQRLMALVEKTDRSKALWFAGNADKTPLGENVGDIYGAVDLDGGIDVDVIAHTKSEKLAKQAVDGLDDAKKAAGMFGPELAEVLGEIKLSRNDEKLRFQMSLSTKQIEKVMSLAGKGLR
jgi:hypothetical protein